MRFEALLETGLVLRFFLVAYFSSRFYTLILCMFLFKYTFLGCFLGASLL